MADDNDKTEDASPHKLEEARGKGDVPKSKEFISFFMLLGAIFSFYFASQHVFQEVVALLQKFFNFQQIKLVTTIDYMNMVTALVAQILWILTPLCSAIFIFGIGAHLGQFGLLFSTEKITPKLDALNPLEGLKRLFSKDSLPELIKSVIKMVCVSGLFYLILRGETENLLLIGSLPLGKIFMYLIHMISQVMFVMLLFMAALGVSDFFYTKRSYAKKMMMSAQEIKDEGKNREGDPIVKNRIRQMQRELARARMMEDVPKADVVVTNPTHVAVALQYRKGITRAPVVIAKGAGYIALRIKEIAAEAQVPILERKQLARFLYRNVEVNEPIPESLYTAVAEVLAFVYKMKKQFSKWRENHAAV
ncbi:MAG: Flagellar biosynthetic protein FlhB [Bacteriovoracaceae bacterium]|nr:Flagellar biosynthetic protein FlhB [Bacteriovoracaceae bacterium]